MTLLENQRAADIPTNTFQDLEDQLMTNIIRHCKDYNQPIASDEWLMRKLAEDRETESGKYQDYSKIHWPLSNCNGTYAQ